MDLAIRDSNGDKQVMDGNGAFSWRLNRKQLAEIDQCTLRSEGHRIIAEGSCEAADRVRDEGEGAACSSAIGAG